jgi:large-conductance mechanosensitive channel
MSDSPRVPEPAQYSTPATPPPYGAYPVAPGINVLAIISLVTAFMMPIAGVITGHIALSQIRRTGEQGEGLAKAGLILSYVFIGVGLLAVIAYVIFFVILVSASSYSNSGY